MSPAWALQTLEVSQCLNQLAVGCFLASGLTALPAKVVEKRWKHSVY